MPGKICKGNGLSETCCHLSEVRARRLRLDRVNALGLISSQFHRFPPKRGTVEHRGTRVPHLEALRRKGYVATVEPWNKIFKNFHEIYTYILLEQMSIYMYALIYAVFFVPQFHTPPKKVVESLAAQGLRAVEPVFHARSSCSTLQRQFIRIFLVIQLHGGQPQAEAFRGDTIDTLPLGVGTPAGLNQGFLLQV